MTQRARHGSLLPGEGAILARLADPEATDVEFGYNNPESLGRIIHAAELHCVLPTVAQKLDAAGISAEDLPEPAAGLWRRFRDSHVTAVGQSMLLQHHGKAIAGLFASAGVEAVIVKGPVFAASLYRNWSDRPFTDIDFLVAGNALSKANRLMGSGGFDRQKKAWDNSARDQEYKWTLGSNPRVLVELHGDLVHLPLLRRKVSFGYAQLMQAGEGMPHNPMALMMTAVVHASCGHKFHRLSMLVDVLQALRALGPDDEASLVRVSGAIGLALETAVTLQLAARLFGDRKAFRLAGLFQEKWPIGVGRRLISPVVPFGAQSESRFGSRNRQHAFRVLQQLAFVRH